MKKMAAEKPKMAKKMVEKKATTKEPKKETKTAKVMSVKVKTGGGYGDKGETVKGMKKRDMGEERRERRGER